MKKILLIAVTIMTAMSAMAQKIEVVDADGNGIPLVSVTTEDGVFIGKTDQNGVLADVKGAQKVGLSHESDMTLEELQAYEREHNIPAFDATQLKAIEALKKHY